MLSPSSTLIFLISGLKLTLAQACADSSDMVPLWRAYSSSATDHFYTTNVTEMETALALEGYALEGASAYIWTTQETGTVPLYRLWNLNETDHFYTQSAHELAEMMSAGWADDSNPIAGYVYPYSICGASPIYRLYNPTVVDHFYGMNIAEGEAASGYEVQGIAGYAVLPSVNGAAVLNSPFPFLLPSTVTASPASKVTVSAETTSSCAITGDAVPLLRAYSSTEGDHFYTINATEMNNAVTADAYAFEGDATFLWATQEIDTVPLYRMFSQEGTDHFYTIDENELSEASALGYAFDTTSHIAGYVYPYSICGASPIYRLYSGQQTDHFYTQDYAEALRAAPGYFIEGIAGFALLPSVDGSVTTATASVSPFFLPFSAAPSAISVSLTLKSALVTGTGTSAVGAFTTSNGAAGSNPTLASTVTPGASRSKSNGAQIQTLASYSLSVALVMGVLVLS